MTDQMKRLEMSLKSEVDALQQMQKGEMPRIFGISSCDMRHEMPPVMP